MNKVDRINELVNILNAATEAYDRGENSGYTDTEWDKMYFELQNLEQETGYISADSPTHKINYEVKNELNKVEHNHPLLSLAKTKSIDELEEFIGDKHYLTMLKVDGLTLSIRYVDGKLVSAETRGDGVIGEDVTHNAYVIKNLPKRIDYKKELIVDGEAIIYWHDFEKFSDEYANPRNLVAGSVRLLDPREAEKRNISFIAWDCYKGFEGEEWLSTRLNQLDRLGFTTVPRRESVYSDKTTEDLMNEIVEESKSLGIPYDGIVVKYDSCKEYQAAGKTEHHFSGGKAFKFADEEYETHLQGIEYDVSRTGQMTPVAVFDPVDDGVSVITRASLHNITVMKKILDKPYVGQKIYVAKMNAIIPQVVRAEASIFFSPIELPSVCPVCGEPVSYYTSMTGVENLYCDNPKCSRKFTQQLMHYCSKSGLDIRGLSDKRLSFLVDKDWLTCIKDLYTLKDHRDEWIKCPGYGAVSVDKILQAIEVSRDAALDKFIVALGIPEIGTKAGKDLAKKFGGWDKFREAKYEDLISIDEFGEVMCKNIINFNYTEADELAELMHHLNIGMEEPYRVELSVEENNVTSTNLSGETFVITGKLSRGRFEIEDMITSAGGKVTGSVSGKTSYLVIDDVNSTTGKAKKARELGIPMISEEELYAMIN